MKQVNAYAANEAGGKLSPFKYELPELGSDHVDIKVHYCGLLYSMFSYYFDTTEYAEILQYISLYTLNKSSPITSKN